MESNKTSVLVIGGGPGGYVAAIRAAQLGADVTVVEKNKLGGTCLNRGCIPSKVLLHSAEAYEIAKNSASLGVTTSGAVLNWDVVQKRRAAICNQLTGGIGGLLNANKVTVVNGTAHFVGPKKVAVEKADGSSVTLEPDKIIIASGSEPAMPPIPGTKDNPDCIDSTACLELDHVPSSLIVIGGGVIGLELGSAYMKFGSKVTVVEMLPRLLPPMDLELTNILERNLKASGMDIRTSTAAKSVERFEGGSRLTVTKDGVDSVIEAEKILICVGRRASTKSLDLEAAGIASERGVIQVNDKMETNVPGVYAIGDCNGKLMLAHTASAMGEVAAENALGAENLYSSHTAPSCVYVGPEFACAGLNEEQVKAAGLSYTVGKFPTAANGRSLIMGETRGMMKVIAEQGTGKILGIHILGERAGDIIQEAAMALRFDATIDEFVSTIHGHPSVAEALREAALAAEKRCIHMPNR